MKTIEGTLRKSKHPTYSLTTLFVCFFGKDMPANSYTEQSQLTRLSFDWQVSAN